MNPLKVLGQGSTHAVLALIAALLSVDPTAFSKMLSAGPIGYAAIVFAVLGVVLNDSSSLPFKLPFKIVANVAPSAGPDKSPSDPTSPVGQVIGAILLALMMTAGLSACSSTGTLGTFTAQQSAHIDYVAATAGLNDAAAVAALPGLSTADKAGIKAGGAAFESAVEAQVSAMLTAGSVTAEVESAAISATATAAQSLGTLLTAAHGSSATAADIAVAAGLDGLQQLPQVVTAVVSVQSGYAPSAADLANDLAAMQAQAAKLAAL